MTLQTLAPPRANSLTANLASLIEADLELEASALGGGFWPVEPLNNGSRDVLAGLVAAAQGPRRLPRIRARLGL